MKVAVERPLTIKLKTAEIELPFSEGLPKKEKMGETGLSEGPWTVRPPGPYAVFRSENDIRRTAIHIYPEKTRGHPRRELYTEEGQRKEKKATPQESTSI